MSAALYEPLVYATRELLGASLSQVDRIHYGAVAVVDSQGTLLYSVGDASAVIFPRSALKPFQALPLVERGGHDSLGLSEQALALMCASHNGEIVHINIVEDVLARADCNETQLSCGCHTPNFYRWQNISPPPELVISQVHNTCSGKHAGFLAWCKVHGASPEHYLRLTHPLQLAIREAVSRSCEVLSENMPVGSDNCSAPNFGMPLRSLALGYAKLAQGDGALGELGRAMTAYPYLGSGEHRNDYDFMRVSSGDWISKIGAGGIQAVGVRSAGIGIAVKVSDGDRLAQITAALEVLSQLGLADQTEQALLSKWARQPVKNLLQEVIGETSAGFVLRKHS